MGKVKDLYIDMQNYAYELNLANKLGITLDDLMRLDWNIETEESDDGLVYCHRVEFSSDSPRTILSKVKNLEEGKWVYLQPGELETDSEYTELFDAIIQEKEYVKNFKDALIDLEDLLKIDIVEERLQLIFYRQALIGVVSTMEAFLTDAFVNLTFGDERYFRSLVETHPEFKKRKFDLSNIFSESTKLRETAKKVLLDINYHNLPAIKQMYQDTFKIRFPRITEMHQYVLMRHDLVHRNGKTKDGQEVEIDKETVVGAIDTANEFIREIAQVLRI